MVGHGIRYIVVTVGSPEDPAKDEDCEVIKGIMDLNLPFKITVLSEYVSNKVTLALLQERGVL